MEPLDLKYRPRNFSSVCGNAGPVKILKSKSRSRDISRRSILLGGQKGLGKTTIARIIARSILCDNLNDGDPCGQCDTCNSINSSSSNLYEEFDAATQGSVEKIRGFLEDLEFFTFEGKPKVITMDEAHRLSIQAQDALLKPLEDRRLFIIMCTTEPHKIRVPVRSRLEEYSISPPDEKELVERLSLICKEESIPYSQSSLATISNLTGLCPRESICAVESIFISYGSINDDNIKYHFRFDDISSLISSLHFLRDDIRESISILDRCASASPFWIRDKLVDIINSAFRISIGLKVSFNFDNSFINSGTKSWSEFCKNLSLIEKPTHSDILSLYIWFHNYSSDETPQTPTNPSNIRIAPRPPSPEEYLPKSTGKTVEIDGIVFTSNEDLTSIDKKIEKGRSNNKVPDIETNQVKSNNTNVPISEAEFSSEFSRRIKRSK